MKCNKCRKDLLENLEYCPSCKAEENLNNNTNIKNNQTSIHIEDNNHIIQDNKTENVVDIMIPNEYKKTPGGTLGHIFTIIVSPFIVIFFYISAALMSANGPGLASYIFWSLAAVFTILGIRSLIYAFTPTKKLEKLIKYKLTFVISIAVVIVYFGPIVMDYIKYDIGNDERYPSLMGQVDKERVLVSNNAFVSRNQKELKISNIQFTNGIIFNDINNAFVYYNNAAENVITGTMIFDNQGSNMESVVLEIYESIWDRVGGSNPSQGELYESFMLYNHQPTNLSINMKKYYTGSGSIMFSIKSESNNLKGIVIIGDMTFDRE